MENYKQLNRYAPKIGDVFKWCEAEYICIESGDTCGVVNPVGQTFYITNFNWEIGENVSTFVRTLKEKEFNNVFEKL